jgi:predicted O-methyltransferase YrrM
MQSKFLLFIKTILRLFFYFFSSYRRYANIIITILLNKPKIILEIGVYKGKRSLEMIEAAKLFNNKIFYFGFDLFEDFFKKKNILKVEFSKEPKNFNFIKEKIGAIANVFLYKGYTKNTLPLFIKKKVKPDLIFIDGGHSIETISNDWSFVKKMMKKTTVVIFDDYYSNSKSIIKKFGCNKIIHNLEKKYTWRLLPLKDEIFLNQSMIKINLVSVRLK